MTMIAKVSCSPSAAQHYFDSGQFGQWLQYDDDDDDDDQDSDDDEDDDNDS